MENKNELELTGLTSKEAAELAGAGKANVVGEKGGKGYLGIIADNLFTFFNLVYLIITIALMAVVVMKGIDNIKNLGYLAVVVPNILIAIVQQIRAKRTVEKLSVTTDPRATVIRDGKEVSINATEIVLGDIMYVEMGRQVLSDGVVVSGLAEANESMLTGESDAIKKQEGDRVLAGSYLVSGGVYVRVTAVGKDNYVHRIEKAAKSFKAPASNLFRDLNNLIKYIGIFMVPMTVLLFLSNWFSSGKDIAATITSVSGSLIGMIPAGMYLLITLTLTLSVISLGKKNTLVQDMYSIEMLASADVVCLDKTGTITDGTMQVTAVEPLSSMGETEITSVMAIIEGSEKSINNTSRALIDRFGKNTEANILEKIPFSSARKYSAVNIEEVGCFQIGAPHFVSAPISEELDGKIAERAENGERVLLLVKQDSLDAQGEAVAMIAISDRIRPNAMETIAKFQEAGVAVKVISGDHAATVSTIAKRVGIKDAEKYLSCDTVSDEELARVANDYAVFGRVTPEQKVLLVKTFKAAGHTVAMTGDGVNDTLALKESDCSVAMADGSEVARRVAKIVLMKSDFGTLPDVVKEGRRCINNVRMSASLFLMKTLFAILLSIISVVASVRYPLQSSQLIPIELFIIGFASLALSIEPNDKRVEGSFIKSVLIRSLPNALAMLMPVITAVILVKAGFIDMVSVVSDSGEILKWGVGSAIATASVTLIGFINLLFLCRPYTKWRAGVVGIVAGLLATVVPVATFLLNDMFEITPLAKEPVISFAVLGLGVAVALLIHLGRIIFNIKHSREK